MRSKLHLLLAIFWAGCASSSTVKEHQGRIARLQAEADGLGGRLRERDASISALEGQKADLEAKAQELSGKLAAAQAQVESLEKSNQDLSRAMESNKGELVAKVKELVGEKDALARRLGQAQKGQAAVQAARDRAAAKAARLEAARAGLATEVDAFKAAQAAEAKDRSARLDRTHEEMGTLADAILKEIQAERAQVEQDGGRIALTLQAPLLFSANQAKLTAEGTALLDRLGKALHALRGREMRIQGHTDNKPIKWELFGHFTNHWDLSAAQAIAVARYLHEHAGLDPRKITAEGCGEFRPARPNASEADRAANRRVLILIEPAP